MKKIIIALLVIALLGGGAFWLVTERQEANRKEAAAAKIEAEKEAAQKAIETCRREVGPFIEELSDINAQLDIGMNEDAYSTAVRKAAIEENRVDDIDLSNMCLDALDVAQDALEAYSMLSGAWNECIYEPSCDVDSTVDFSPWIDAEEMIEEAEDLMLGRGNSSNL